MFFDLGFVMCHLLLCSLLHCVFCSSHFVLAMCVGVLLMLLSVARCSCTASGVL